jgi:hypothetical protein
MNATLKSMKDYEKRASVETESIGKCVLYSGGEWAEIPNLGADACDCVPRFFLAGDLCEVEMRLPEVLPRPRFLLEHNSEFRTITILITS